MLKKYKFKNYNFMLLISVIAAMIVGIFAINIAAPANTTKQAIGIVGAVAVMIILSLIDYHFICKFFIPIYILSDILLVAVLLFGDGVNNAVRWFTFAGITFQPSELCKILMIIFMAQMLSHFKEKEKINSICCIFLFLVTTAIPIFLIYKEPDLSTTLCFIGIMILMLYLAGLSYKLIGIAILILVPVTGTFIWYIQKPDQKLLYEHQVQRILSFIYPEKYAEENLQQLNSVMAIGSGKLGGKGIHLDAAANAASSSLISERQTDFIFSVIGEATGFVGSVLVIGLILFIVLECIRVARRSKDDCGMLLAGGAASLIGLQSFINIGVATSLIPNTGIPLPFISYGLTSLLSIAICIGIVLNVSLQKKQF